VVQTALAKNNFREAGASLMEMEAAGVAKAAAELRKSFYCVRVVSDPAGEDFANNFNDALRPDGRFSVTRLITGAMRDPQRRFAELIRLQKRTALAAKNLGDFLAHCEY
jgi:adenosylhomocysteine nucleosidase